MLSKHFAEQTAGATHMKMRADDATLKPLRTV
jgi:hypothetical protein